MPHANENLIKAIRDTAKNLSSGARYEWGHMARCNCGHLVQSITKKTDKEIVKIIDHQLDEWTEHAKDYCSGTGSKVDELFETMKSYGFSHEDIVHLEYLSDRKVLDRLGENIYLRHNNVEDVVKYLEEMATMLEENLENKAILV